MKLSGYNRRHILQNRKLFELILVSYLSVRRTRALPSCKQGRIHFSWK